MKKINCLLILFALSAISFAQIDGMSYQAVIIDNNPQEIPGVDIPANNLPNVPLTVQFSILDDSNTVEYQETHETNTDSFGMINLMIGQGSQTGDSNGNFDQIYWNNAKFLRVEIDLFDGNGLVEFSFQELTYIPYVKHREIIATATLDVDGNTNLNSNFTVNNASPSYLTGDLTVDGETNLNSALTVQNQSPTLLTGDLRVEGVVTFDGGLDVGGDTQLYADLTVEGNTLLNGNLDVIGQANFNDSNFQNITVAQNSNLNVLDVSGVSTLQNQLLVNGTSFLNNGLFVDVNANITGTLDVTERSDFGGQVWINANRDSFGGELNSAAYPLRVSGSRQGIEIELTGDAAGDRPSNGNNFVSFSSDTVRYGRIEGQTYNELTSSFLFVWNQTQEGLETAFQVAMVAVDILGVDDFDAAVVEGIEMVDMIANWVAIRTHMINNLGVAFESGFGDYAEWLEKENTNEPFSFGDIIGVSGGKISKNTESADHVMVVSQNPIVLGNMPQANREKDYEKVAFMGQVPVKVMGQVNIGDYIIPSGQHDGIGRAVSPKNLQLDDYSSIVGVAWSNSEKSGLSLINLAVGINTNDTALLLKKQQEEINNLKAGLNEIMAYLQSKDKTFEPQGITTSTKPSKSLSNLASQGNTNLKNANASVSGGKRKPNQVNVTPQNRSLPQDLANKYRQILELVEENPEVLDEIMADAKAYLDAKNVQYSLYDQTNRVVTDRSYLMNYLRELAE